MKLVDNFNREHNYLRISLTDKCNYNCLYCNPDGLKYSTIRSELLSYEELYKIIELFASKLKFTKFRFTGGEALTRNGVFKFFEEIKYLKSKFGFTTGLTTNGSLLNGKVEYLKKIGIDNLNISLDSILDRNFNFITGRNDLKNILDVIDQGISAGYDPLKINVVVIKKINDMEIIAFVNHFKDKPVNLRFIEFMPFGGNSWEETGFISYNEMIAMLQERFELEELGSENNSVAKDFKLINHKAQISFISSISEHFCGTCNRLRITSTGDLKLCLFSEKNTNLSIKNLLRDNSSDDEILEAIQSKIRSKWFKHPNVDVLTKLKENNMMAIGG